MKITKSYNKYWRECKIHHQKHNLKNYQKLFNKKIASIWKSHRWRVRHPIFPKLPKHKTFKFLSQYNLIKQYNLLAIKKSAYQIRIKIGQVLRTKLYWILLNLRKKIRKHVTKQLWQVLNQVIILISSVVLKTQQLRINRIRIIYLYRNCRFLS